MSNEEMQRFRKGVEAIWSNDSLTDAQKRVALSVLAEKFNKTAFINIVEEPEQNLFPNSQWQLLQSLLDFNAMTAGNKLIITTHSPYIVNYLSLSIQGKYLECKIKANGNRQDLIEKLYNLIPEKSLVNANEAIVYQLNEIDGSVNQLAVVDGIPSDSNYLNAMLAEGNELFDELLGIEQEL